MRRHGHGSCTVPPPPPSAPRVPLAAYLRSGYWERARAKGVWPQAGTEGPWRDHQNVFRDWWMLTRQPVDDGVVTFSGGAGRGGPRSALYDTL